MVVDSRLGFLLVDHRHHHSIVALSLSLSSPFFFSKVTNDDTVSIVPNRPQTRHLLVRFRWHELSGSSNRGVHGLRSHCDMDRVDEEREKR